MWAANLLQSPRISPPFFKLFQSWGLIPNAFGDRNREQRADGNPQWDHHLDQVVVIVSPPPPPPQGLNGTALWVLAHECGHQAFSDHRLLNDAVGFALHSFLLTPTQGPPGGGGPILTSLGEGRMFRPRSHGHRSLHSRCCHPNRLLRVLRVEFQRRGPCQLLLMGADACEAPPADKQPGRGGDVGAARRGRPGQAEAQVLPDPRPGPTSKEPHAAAMPHVFSCVVLEGSAVAPQGSSFGSPPRGRWGGITTSSPTPAVCPCAKAAGFAPITWLDCRWTAWLGYRKVHGLLQIAVIT